MIVSLLNQKGGVGKTTLAVHLAMAMARRGQRVLLIDADPQGSTLDWAASRESENPLTIVGLPKPTLHKELPKMTGDYETVVIDGAPRVNDLARSAVMASDLVLIPVQPSPYDVWAAKEIVEMTHDALSFKENLKTAFVINRKIVNTALGRDVTIALGEYNVPILKSHVCQRIGFAESAATGQTVLEMAPMSPASREIETLADEVLETLK